MSSILDIANGTIRNIVGSNEELYRSRIKICYSCPLYLKKFGGICNHRLWLNPITGDVSSIKKEGYFRGCGCLLSSKTRLPNVKCPAGKW